MGIKTGYIQTELGLIPDDWKVSPFSELFDISAGGDLNPKLSSTEHDELHRYPIYSNTVTDSGLYGFCSYADHPAGSVTITARGTLGVANYRDHDYTAIGRVLILEPKGETTGRYVAEFINDQVRFIVESTGVPQLTAPQVSKYKLVVPSLLEQSAIVQILSNVDELLAGLKRLIAKKRDLKQAAMQQLLTGPTRLSDFNGEWEQKRLGEICSKIQDGTHFSPKLGGNDYLYVTSKNIRFGVLDMTTAERISVQEHNKIYSRCDVKLNDLLITKDGASTGNAALNTLHEPFSLLSSVALLRFDQTRFVPGFFLYQILSPQGQEQIKGMMSGNAITRLTLSKIKALRFRVPSFDEQKAIVSILSEMDDELLSLEQRLAKTRDIKQGMMQELLTGKTRLITPEALDARKTSL